MASTKPSLWRRIDTETYSAVLGYDSLASLGAIGPHCTAIHVSAAEAASTYSGDVAVILHAQRVADDRWVALSAAGVTVASAGASPSGAETVEIPAGIYDAVAYVLSGTLSAGSIVVTTNLRYDADA